MKKKEEILELLDGLFGDTTVAPWETRNALEEIKDEIQIKLDALASDETAED